MRAGGGSAQAGVHAQHSGAPAAAATAATQRAVQRGQGERGRAGHATVQLAILRPLAAALDVSVVVAPAAPPAAAGDGPANAAIIAWCAMLSLKIS